MNLFFGVCFIAGILFVGIAVVVTFISLFFVDKEIK